METTASRPPALAGLPGIGNSLSAFLRAGEFFVDGYRKCGPAFRVTLLGEEYVVLTGEEMMEFFARGGEKFLERSGFFAAYAAEMGDSKFILATSGEDHARLRRMLSLGFSRQVAGPFVPQLAENTRAAAAARIGKPVSTMSYLTRVFLEHYGKLFADRALTEHYRDALVFTVTAMMIGAHSMPAWSGRWVPLYQRSRKKMAGLAKAAVADRLANGAQDNRYTVIDALLNAKDAKGEGLSEEAMLGGALHGLVGCMFYTTRMAGFLLYDLLANPKLTQKVVEEIDDVCGDDALNIKMLRSLAHLRAALTESQRLHPVAMVLPYDVKEDFTFEGFTVAKGEQVLLSTLTGNFSERYFRRPYQYDASRCMAPRNEHAAKGAMNPFGLGGRTCNAIGLVETMILTTVTTMLREFELSMEPSDHVLATLPSPLPSPGPGFKLLFSAPRKPIIRKEKASREASMQAAAMMAGVGDSPALQEVLARAELVEYDGGITIIKQGDVAEHFFIVMDGAVDVFKEAEGVAPQFLARLQPGLFFGEIGLLKGVRRTATVKAAVGQVAKVLVLSREDFMGMVADNDLISDEIAAVVRRRYLSSKLAEAMPNVDMSKASGMLDDIEVRAVRPGEVIIRQGDPAEEFFIVSKGKVEVIIDQPDGTHKTVAVLSPGEFFGETGILQHSKRNATVKAGDSEAVEVMVIGRTPFEKMVADSPGALNDIALRMAQRVVTAFKKKGGDA